MSYPSLSTDLTRTIYEEFLSSNPYNYSSSLLSSPVISKPYTRSDLHRMYTTLKLEYTYQSLYKWEQDIKSFSIKLSLAEEALKYLIVEVFRSKYQKRDEKLKEIYKHMDHVKILQTSILYDRPESIEIDSLADNFLESLNSSVLFPEIDLDYYINMMLSTVDSEDKVDQIKVEVAKMKSNCEKTYRERVAKATKYDIRNQIEKIQDMIEKVRDKIEGEEIEIDSNKLDSLCIFYKRICYRAVDCTKIYEMKNKKQVVICTFIGISSDLCVWNKEDRRSEFKFYISGKIIDFTVSSDDKFILMIISNNTIELRNLISREFLFSIKAGYTELSKILFLPCDKQFILSSDQHLTIWSLHSKRVIKSVQLEEKMSISHLVLMNNGSKVLICNNKKEIFVMNLNTMRKERSLICKRLNIMQLMIVYSEKYAIFNTDFKTILWDIEGNKEIFKIMSSHPFCVLKDRYLLLYSSKGAKVVVYDLKMKKSRDDKIYAKEGEKEIITFVDAKVFMGSFINPVELVIYYI
jgi:WD40 repeat protein